MSCAASSRQADTQAGLLFDARMPLVLWECLHASTSPDLVLAAGAARFSFRIPPYYTLLVRSLSVLEGIALASDPNYKASH